MASVNSIVSRAMRLSGNLGTGETMDAAEAADGMEALNSMLDAWALEKLMLFKFDTLTFTPTASSFTIGPTGNLVTVRPIEILSAYRKSGGVDLPVQILSREQYESILLKELSNKVQALYYKPEYPNGRVFVWPVATNEPLFLSLQQPITGFTSTADAIVLPPGYEEALTFNLAVLLCAEYNKDASRAVVRQAMNTKRLIKTVNNEVPMLSVDPALDGSASAVQWWTPPR